jgi:glycosyltransferase involved in cell wall biosynthesis
MKIFCIIPAYNEEKTIREVIKQVKPLVDEVVVVDDGSTDKTYDLAKKQGATVLHHLINRGQGAALQTGTDYALGHEAEIILHFDADGQFLADDINSVIKPIKDGECDVVFGSRFLDKKSQIPWFKKKIILPLARIINRLFWGVTITDPQSGFRALDREAAKVIKIEQDRMAHCSEILAKVFINNLKIKEVPITVIYHNFGQRFSDGIKILKDLFLFRLIN